jgi:alpha-tubulin suppressor-like RCC1 family protein
LTRTLLLLASAWLATGCFDAPQITVIGGGPAGTGGADGGTGGTAGVGASGGGAGEGGASLAPVCDATVREGCAEVERIWGGGSFTCAGLDDDTVRCFGLNDSGQLGSSSAPTSKFAMGVVVEGVPASAQISLGDRHGCAVVDGVAKCWGRNTLGQLGTGDFRFHSVPVANLVAAPVEAVSTFQSATCAVASGEVVCWGLALNGESWAGWDDGEAVVVPSLVNGLDSVVEVGVGTLHACALRADDTVWCWGFGGDGSLGRGDTLDSTTPAPVAESLAHPVHRLAVAGAQSCVLAGEPPVVQCWGSLPDLQGPTTEPTTMSAQPTGEVLDLQLGQRHACVLLADGRVQCWGRNTHGQLGTGSAETETPTSVTGLVDAFGLALGSTHVCALHGESELVCWGHNIFGQLGIPDGNSRGTPEPVPWN